MDGSKGAAGGLPARPPGMVGLDGSRVDHGADGFRSGCGADDTCHGCSSSSATPTSYSSSSSSLGSNSSLRGSTSSSTTTSSSDFMDDATSSSPSERLSPLCEMGALMADLPIKNGLSRHFQGKSQSFASLAAVGSVDDLAKPIRSPWQQRSKGRMLKACKSRSYAGGLNNGHAPPVSPNGRAISKPKKHYPCCLACRRTNTGGGGFWAAAAAAAAGRLPPVHAHHQRHGAAVGGCLGRHQHHALLFA